MHTRAPNHPWWRDLGFHAPSVKSPSASHAEEAAALAALISAHPPTAFGEEGLTLAELTARIDEIPGRVAAVVAARNAEKYAEVRRRLDAVESRPDADRPAEGTWEGFTMGELLSWTWVLTYVQPRGFAMPYGQMHWENMKSLNAGGLPRFHWTYPEEARKFRDWGVTPRQYLQTHEKQGTSLARRA